MNLLLELAAADPNAQQTNPSNSGSPWTSMLPILAAVAIFYIFMFRGRNKERGKFEQMLKDLKRNDRVQTIGGMLGTVVEVRDNEVVLKIDEASNTKVRVTRGAIKEVIAPAAEEQK